MPELWGIDDNKEARRLRQVSLTSFRFSRTHWKGVLIAGCITGLFAALFFMVDLKPAWLKGAIAGGLGGVAASYYWGKKQRATMEPILEKEGRCTNCGYNVKENNSKACPECGQVVSKHE